MTIPANQPLRVEVPLNGVATEFSFSPMIIFSAAEFEVLVAMDNGSVFVATEGTGPNHYSLHVDQFPGTGFIRYPADQITPFDDGRLIMRSNLPISQEQNYENQGGYFPKVQERVVDRLTVQNLQQQEEIDRTMRISPASPGVSTELPIPIPNAALGWNSQGDGMANLIELPDALTITALGQSLIDQNTPADVRQILHQDFTEHDILIGASGGGSELIDLYDLLQALPMNPGVAKDTPRVRLRGTHGGAVEYAVAQVGANLALQRNDGTTETPTWTNIAIYTQSTNTWTLTQHVTISGNVVNTGGITSAGNLEVIRGTGSPEIGVQSTHNNSTAAVRARGKTAGGGVIDGRIQSEAGGSVQIGSWSPHEILLMVDGNNIARFTSDGRVLGWPHGYRSSEQSITNGSTITLSHSMLERPSYVTAELVCVSDSQGHSTGDRLVLAATDRFADAVHHGIQVKWNATQIQVLIASQGVAILNGSSYATTGITNSNWRIVVTAWP